MKHFFSRTMLWLVLLLVLALGLGVHIEAQGDDPNKPSSVEAPTSFLLYDGLAIGVNYEDIGNHADAGMVNILPGSYAGLTEIGNRGWTQDTPGMLDEVEENDRFGESLASGDFNGDGYPDLAIGAPGETVGRVEEAGGVQILYGSAEGFTTNGNQWWNQDVPGVPGGAEKGDWFGAALAVGDFDGDGYDDLAIGIPWEDLGNSPDAGAVYVMYGSPNGLTTDGGQWWDQDSPGVIGSVEEGDNFGIVLTAGDFNGDGRDDLAIGVPQEDLGNIVNAGAVQILFGSNNGLTADGNQWWDQDVPGIQGGAENNDGFGFSLAAGDFDGDGYDDLAIGIPWEDIITAVNGGAVQVLYGSSGGLTASGSQWWDQNTDGIPGSTGVRDYFGYALAAGDFNHDGRMDLAIGVPGEDLGSLTGAGAVQVLYGTASGLSASGNQWWDQSNPNLPGLADNENYFGTVLATGDFNGDGYDDLAVGIPEEDVASVVDAGAVQVIYGSSQGLKDAGSQWWTQDTQGIVDVAEKEDYFGFALVSIRRTSDVSCPKDPYESNDTFGTAYDATTDFRDFGGLNIMDDAYLCPSLDVDFYQFPVQAGETIHASISSLPADYDLHLYDPDGNVVAYSLNGGLQDETIDYVATKTGNYRARVIGSQSSWSATEAYSMRIYTEVTSQPGCGDSAYEPNESFSQAAAISPGVIQAYLCDATDEDWFRFDVTAGQTIQVSLTNLPADYDLFLYNPSGDTVGESLQSGTTDESISHQALTSGAYRVRVVGYQGAYNATTPYRLSVALTTGQQKLFLPRIQSK